MDAESTVLDLVGLSTMPPVTRDIPGAFVGARDGCLRTRKGYLGSYQGISLARSKEADFPVLETVRVSDTPLTSVSENRQFVYVAASDGHLSVFRSTPGIQVN